MHQVDRELPDYSDAEKLTEVLKRAEMLPYAGNPLVARSIEAIRMADLQNCWKGPVVDVIIEKNY